MALPISEQDKIAKNILQEIIKRKGFIGRCAELCRNDQALTDQFIRDCYTQCHIETAINIWGKALIERISEYVKKYPSKTTNEY